MVRPTKSGEESACGRGRRGRGGRGGGRGGGGGRWDGRRLGEAEIDGGDCLRLRLCFEELALAEAERPGNQDVGERLDRWVGVENAGVVVLAREADLVLSRGQLLLQLEHVLVRLQL